MRKALLRHLSVTLDGFAGKIAREDAKLGDDLAAHVAKLEMSLGLEWRLQQSLLRAVPAMAQVEIRCLAHDARVQQTALTCSIWCSRTLQGIRHNLYTLKGAPELSLQHSHIPGLMLHQTDTLESGHLSPKCCCADNEHGCII